MSLGSVPHTARQYGAGSVSKLRLRISNRWTVGAASRFSRPRPVGSRGRAWS